MTPPDPHLDRAHALHQQILDALRVQRSTELTLARLLRSMADERLYEMFGYGSVRDYAERALDLDARRTRELLLLGKRLPDLPGVEAALEAGELSWSKAREIARVATGETEGAWIERARACSVRVVEQEVAAARRGDAPPDGEPEAPVGPARRRVVFDMESEEAEKLRAALAVFRARAGSEVAELGDGAIVAILAQRYLHDDDDAAVSAERYAVVIQRCPDCARADGHNAEVRDTLVAEACCDAVHVDARPGPNEGRRTRAIPPRVRRRVLARDAHRCVVPGCTNRLWLDLHHLRPFAAGGDHGQDNLVTLCTAHHRLHHEGRLALERIGPLELRVGFANGRVHRVRLGAGGWAVGAVPRGMGRGDPRCGGRAGWSDASAIEGRASGEVAHVGWAEPNDPRGSP